MDIVSNKAVFVNGRNSLSIAHLRTSIASVLDKPQTSERECPAIMPWFLAIAEVVNAGGKLAPQKAVQKLLQELADNNRQTKSNTKYSVSVSIDIQHHLTLSQTSNSPL